MSEYTERHSVARLTGAPPGYVGYEEGGQLTEAVRRHPYAVVLLDEIEKAHPEVHTVLLQVLDDGRLTDSQGRLVDFRNAVFILTSNVGSGEILEMTERGASYEEMRDRVTQEIRRSFRPEFLNRVDEMVVFRSLERDQIGKIVEIQLDRLRARLKDQQIDLAADPEAIRLLANLGYDRLYGARPVRRAIQQQVETPAARMMLEGSLGPRATLRVEAEGAEVRLAAA